MPALEEAVPVPPVDMAFLVVGQKLGYFIFPVVNCCLVWSLVVKAFRQELQWVVLELIIDSFDKVDAVLTLVL